MNHLEEAKRRFERAENGDNLDDYWRERGRQAAQIHALISIAESLEKLASPVVMTTRVEELERRIEEMNTALENVYFRGG